MAQLMKRLSTANGISISLSLIAATIFAIIGLTASWGRADFNVAGVLSGTGDFTLWHVKFSAELDFLGLEVASGSRSIDSFLCDNDLDVKEVVEICEKFHAMRGLMVAALFAALASTLLASMPTLAAFCCSRNRPLAEILIGTCFLAAAATVCTVAALIVAASMARLPRNDYFTVSGRAGAGSICAALGAVCSLLGAIASAIVFCKAKAAPRVAGQKQIELEKGHSPNVIAMA